MKTYKAALHTLLTDRPREHITEVNNMIYATALAATENLTIKIKRTHLEDKFKARNWGNPIQVIDTRWYFKQFQNRKSRYQVEI